MIAPIDHELIHPKRLAWATFALLALLVAGFLAARGEQGFVGGGEEVVLDTALEVWLSHPYLAPDPALLAQASPEALEQARREAEVAKVDPETLAQQQAELDYVTRMALRGADAAPGPTHPFRRFGWIPAAPRVTGLVTHAFLHSGYLHLALAVLLLWLASPALEGSFGRALWLGLCLAGALASAGAYSLAAPESPAPLVGAWGMAASLVGAFALRFAGSSVVFGAKSLVAPGWLVLPWWLVASAILHFALGGERVETGESLAPNLAALATGAGLALGVKLLRIEERRAQRALEARSTAHMDPRVRRALDAHKRGSYDQAISLATAVLRERPDDPDALLAIWNAHVAAGHEARGVPTAKRLIEVYARHGNLAPAARAWDELARAVPSTRLETTVLLRIVPELIVQARRDAAIAALRCVTAPENRSLSVGQAVRAAELASELDPPCALAAARFALGQADLADDKRERLVTLARELEAKLGVTPASLEIAPATAPPSLATEPAPPLELESTSHSATVPTIVLPEPPPTVPPTLPSAPPLPQREGHSSVKVVPAVPVALDPSGLRLRIDGAAPAVLTWERIQAVGVGLVAGVSQKPIVVIDLALNWAENDSGALEVLRMRSDSFRARALVGGEGSALEALRSLLAQLLARSGAVPLPDGGSARGLPFREFPDSSSYERDVLLQAS